MSFAATGIADINAGDDPVDFEDALYCNFIRKPPVDAAGNKAGSRTAQWQQAQTDDYVPLLLVDLQQVNLRQQSRWPIYDLPNGATFHTVIVYARIIAIRHTKYSYHYRVNDGTGLADIYSSKKSLAAKLQKVQSVRNEVERLVKLKPMLPAEQQKIIPSLQRILASTSAQLDCSQLPIGTKVIIHGQPRQRYGSVSIELYNMCVDNEINRNVEIAFKEELLEFHAQTKKKEPKNLNNNHRNMKTQMN